MKKTIVVFTMGPNKNATYMMRKLMLIGLYVARLNVSH